MERTEKISISEARETFCEALELMLKQKIALDTKIKIDSQTVITLGKICDRLWNCGDMLPGDAYDISQDIYPDDNPMKRTYAAAARKLKKSLS